MVCLTSKKALKAELKRRGYSLEHLAKLARKSVNKKSGGKRTKKSLINAIMKRSAASVARLLGFKASSAGGTKRKRKGGKRGRCKYGRKKTGKKGCKKKPGKKRSRGRGKAKKTVDEFGNKMSKCLF